MILDSDLQTERRTVVTVMIVGVGVPVREVMPGRGSRRPALDHQRRQVKVRRLSVMLMDQHIRAPEETEHEQRDHQTHNSHSHRDRWRGTAPGSKSMCWSAATHRGKRIG